MTTADSENLEGVAFEMVSFSSLLKTFHLAILGYLMFGWALPFSWATNLHVYFVPSVMLHWQVNQGTCFLTNMENRIRGQKIPKKEAQGQFIKWVLRCFFSELPSDTTIKRWLYTLLISAWMLSFSQHI